MKKIENPKVVECPTLSPERQVLWNAAAEMERCGKSGVGGSWRGPQICAAIAVDRAGLAMGFSLDRRFDALDVLKAHLGGNISVAKWSDSSDQATVVSAMRQAALS